MLEVAFLAVHLLWMTTAYDMDRVYSMITVDAARAMGIDDFRVAVGSPAHLVVLGEADVREAFRNHSAPMDVVSHGSLVDRPAIEEILAGTAD